MYLFYTSAYRWSDILEILLWDRVGLHFIMVDFILSLGSKYVIAYVEILSYRGNGKSTVRIRLA